MNDHGDKTNEGRSADDQFQEVTSDPEKRSRTLSRKGLQYAIEEKRRQTNTIHERLRGVIRSIEGANNSRISDSVLSDLVTTAEQSLYEQDKCNYVEDKTPLTSEQLTLNHAYVLIDEIKIGQSNKLLETRSRKSRHSHRSRSLSSTSTTSSAARIKALAEAAAARENAEYERIIAEKEHARSEREAELERNRQQERAQHDRDLAMLAANRKVAVADAKLKAIELAIEEQEIEERGEIPGIPHAKTEERTLNWVHSNPNSVTQSLPQKFETKCQPEILKVKDEGRELNWVPSKLASEVPLIKNEVPQQNFPMSKFSEVPRVNTDRHTPSQPFVASTPIRETSASHLIETLTFSNKQLVAGLARQNLPKCHPDTFSGDPTIFHPWKMAFKAMISDAEVSPVNEINYLRSFTSGEPQRLVDNYRKRQQLDPSALLKNLWEELERRFGSPAVITNTLLERMHETAAFSDNENLKLQEFADLCADIESQIAYLPGLAYLNFPNAIQPIVEKLPPSLRGKWEKEIANHYEKNAGAYPGFMVFSKVVQNQAKIKNNPNVHIGAKLTPVLTLTPSRGALNGRALNTNTRPADNGLQSPPEREETAVKRCPFHERTGHSLEECIAFRAKTFEEKNEWIWNNRLCFRCFSGDHQAHNCKQQIKCNTCGDNRHPMLLHKEKPWTNARSNETVNAQCTAVCSTSSGGTSCSKVLLVDVFLKDKSYLVRRVYAIIDEQSNSSLISSELVDELGVLGPQEKYYLSTCTSEKEIKYGRRVTGVSIQSPSGTGFQLPTLIECDSIPQDKHEIPTPEMARRFPHLQEIANEIPPYDSNADVHLLIGRDAPELLKVREFRNGPKGAPWAQRLTLGWTITGQMCLDFAGGPVHALVRRTNLRSANEITSLEVHPCQQTESYELVPCPNRFKIMESLSEQEERLRENIFHTSREDNETSLSCEDRKFLETMETGIHKNETGHWEMPLPFRRTEVRMPSNLSQSVNRLNGLLRMLKKKPQMEKDYLAFMEKILSKGHASPVPQVDVKSESQSGKVWYLPHFGVYHPKKPTQIRVVFDSSAEFEGVSLNKELLSGPDMMNSLLGVLIRFRRENTAVMCDVEQMFHSFHVNPSHRDFLRFLWFEDNVIGKPIIEYRMNVHLFGNGPSPAVATFGLRKTAVDGEESTTDWLRFPPLSKPLTL